MTTTGRPSTAFRKSEGVRFSAICMVVCGRLLHARMKKRKHQVPASHTVAGWGKRCQRKERPLRHVPSRLVNGTRHSHGSVANSGWVDTTGGASMSLSPLSTARSRSESRLLLTRSVLGDIEPSVITARSGVEQQRLVRSASLRVRVPPFSSPPALRACSPGRMALLDPTLVLAAEPA